MGQEVEQGADGAESECARGAGRPVGSAERGELVEEAERELVEEVQRAASGVRVEAWRWWAK